MDSHVLRRIVLRSAGLPRPLVNDWRACSGVTAPHKQANSRTARVRRGTTKTNCGPQHRCSWSKRCVEDSDAPGLGVSSASIVRHIIGSSILAPLESWVGLMSRHPPNTAPTWPHRVRVRTRVGAVAPPFPMAEPPMFCVRSALADPSTARGSASCEHGGGGIIGAHATSGCKRCPLRDTSHHAVPCTGRSFPSMGCVSAPAL